MFRIDDIPDDRPVLIAGPTASGKSALALEIAAHQGGVIVNADAIQVYENWRVLTARPSVEDEAKAPHCLYGRVAFDATYSVGHWLRDIEPVLENHRAIIVGGTGLYFTALTEGLAEIPQTPASVRDQANAIVAAKGHDRLIGDLDRETRQRIDLNNPMRVQRAWEVQTATGRGLADWQDDTPAPLLPMNKCTGIVFQTDKGWLNQRIAQRFDMMLEQGALDEARANLPTWNPAHLSSKAIGAPELIAYLQDEMTLDQAREAATIATRQYAKRQRTWFRSRMKSWLQHDPAT